MLRKFPGCSGLFLILVIAGSAAAQPAPEAETQDEEMVDQPAATAPADIPADAPKLRVEPLEQNLGTIRQGTSTEITYTLFNDGLTPLEIQRVRSDCGCTVATLEKETLAPGEQIKLTATFDSSGRSGQQKKQIGIYSNDPRQPVIMVSFTAEIEVLFRCQPTRTLAFRHQRRGQTLATPIILTPAKPDSTLEILDVHYDKPGLSHVVQPAPPENAGGQQLVLTLDPEIPLGPYNCTLQIKMRVGSEELTAVMTVSGLVVADILVQPQMLFSLVASNNGQELPNGRLTLRAVDNQRPFKLLRIEAPTGLRADIQETRSGVEYRLRFFIDSNVTTGPQAGMINIFTDSSEQPVLQIPAYYNITTQLNIDPPVILFYTDSRLGQHTSQTARITLPADSKLTVSRLDCAAEWLTLSAPAWDEVQHQYSLEIRLVDPAPTVPASTLITIWGEGSDLPIVELPVHYQPDGTIELPELKSTTQPAKAPGE
ncbi:MAG: hypothetical protein HJJLKODD_02013 [Phycisphaerae bacterium]|nr:hypothetical protein [Phycisphaerae bacterium]